MSSFTDRLQHAARFAGVEDHQSAIATALGLKKQTLNRWFMTSGEPNAKILLHIARTWSIDPEWLKTGAGTMIPTSSPDGLTTEERDLIKNYRTATPKVREILRTVARAVRKSIITLSLAIPPYLAPQPADAATGHNYYFGLLNTHWRRLLSRRVLAMLRRALGARSLRDLTT